MDELNSNYSPRFPSKLAISKVINPLPKPTVCRYCSGPVKIANHCEIYGRAYSSWPWAYFCTVCSASVGMHPLTDIPLGTLADANLRRIRRKCKTPFEKIWREGVLTRSEAYSALAQHLGISLEMCHFGYFDAENCLKAESWSKILINS